MRATYKKTFGYLLYTFKEQGIAGISTILENERAIDVSLFPHQPYSQFNL
jgi:hypothetical protein